MPSRKSLCKMHVLGNVKIAMSVKECMPEVQRKYFREFPMQDLLASRRGEAFHGKRKIFHCLFSILREYNFSSGSPVAVLSNDSTSKLWPGSQEKNFRFLEPQISKFHSSPWKLLFCTDFSRNNEIRIYYSNNGPAINFI